MADPTQDWVEPLSDLDPVTGALPEDLHHVQSRGAHPELARTAANLVGISHASHRLLHDTGATLPERRSLFDTF